jgi:hypothetical protein
LKGQELFVLKEHLSKERWEEADKETRLILCKQTGREKDLFLTPEAIEEMECKTFFGINNLWIEYSNNKFGFSIQSSIWLEVGGQAAIYDFYKMNNTDKAKLAMVEREFSKRIGLSFSNNQSCNPTLIGHFPFHSLVCSYGFGLIGLVTAAVAWKCVNFNSVLVHSNFLF